MSDHLLIHSMLAFSLGLSRSLMPFVYLQPQQFGPGWLTFVAHLVHYGSAIMGTVLGQKMASFRWATRRPLFLATLSKTFGLSLLLLATLPLVAQLPPFSAILLLFALFGIGVADGFLQQLLLQRAISNTKSDASPRHDLFMFLLQLSVGPILATFAIQEGSDAVPLEENLCSGLLCQVPIHYSVPLGNLLVLFMLLQVILLCSLWSNSAENRRTSDNDEEDSPVGQLHKHLIKKHGTTSTVCHYRLVLPLCVLGACSAALAHNFPFAVFNTVDNMVDQRTQLLTFTVCILLARLFLTMSNPPKCMLSPNVLLPASLFGAGLTFCTLNVPMLRVYAAGVAGAALGLCGSAVFLQLCYQQNESMHYKKPSTCTSILCSIELGICLFPLLFTQVLSAYGSASQLFSSLALLLILVMTVAFVALLNAEAEQKTATKRGDFWGFWRGGRTRRSIRRFVRNVRTSLRPNRDVHGGRRRLRAPTATTVTTQSALLEESSSGYCVTRSNYQSVQGLNQCHLLLHIPARRPRTNTAGQIMEEAEERRASSRGSATSSATGDGTALRRKHSLPAIVLDAGTPKMSISAGGDQ